MGPNCSAHLPTLCSQKTAPYSDFDKNLYTEYRFIQGDLTEKKLREEFFFLNVDKIIEDSHNKKKSQRFIKWYKMSYTKHERRDLEKSVNLTEYSRSRSKSPISYSIRSQRSNSFFSEIEYNSPVTLAHRAKQTTMNNSGEKVQMNINNIPVFNLNICDLSISNGEKGLRNYYSFHRNHFIQRVFKGPPDSFRWISWLILTGIPESRSSEYFNNLLTYELDFETESQIIKDVNRTMQEHQIQFRNLHDSLYRILKAIAILDKEMTYCQGMNFICGFLLVLSEGNEVDTFYMMMAIFSTTFSNLLGIRDFFTNSFPMLKYYLYVFENTFKKRIPKLYRHFQAIQLPPQCWISKWFQTLFIHIFPEEAVIRIWDCLFSKGISFIIGFSISLLMLLEKRLVEFTDIVDANDYFLRLNPIANKLDESKRIEYSIESLIRDADKHRILNEEMERLRIEFNAIEMTNCTWNKVYYYKAIQPYSSPSKEQPKACSPNKASTSMSFSITVEPVIKSVNNECDDDEKEIQEFFDINTENEKVVCHKLTQHMSSNIRLRFTNPYGHK